jgi:hypothetical protein
MMYAYDGANLIELGHPVTENFLNIYTIDSYDKINQDAEATLFMTCQINNIRSNINLLNMLNNRFCVKNNEIATYATTYGSYTLSNNSSHNIINSILYLNLTNSTQSLISSILKKYNLPAVLVSQFSNKLCSTVTRIVLNTYYPFIEIIHNFIEIDLSMYVNYIAACFASLEEIFKRRYNKTHPDPTIDPNPKLATIDRPLLNRLTRSSDFNVKFQEILQPIDELIYNEAGTDNFFVWMEELVSYGTKRLKAVKDASEYIRDITNGIAGLVGLALMFAMLSSSNKGSKTALYLHFIAAKKWSQVY